MKMCLRGMMWRKVSIGCSYSASCHLGPYARPTRRQTIIWTRPRGYSRKFNTQDYLKSWLGSDVIDKKSSPLSSIQGSHVRKQIKRQSSEDMLKPQQVFSLTVDWNRSSQDMTNTLPPLNSPITTFISLSNIRPDISIDRLREVVIAFKSRGYEVVFTDVPPHFVPTMQENRLTYILHSIFSNDIHHPTSQPSTLAPPAPSPTTAQSTVFLPPTSKVYYGTVRSGQQLYAEKQSLVIFGSVNEGSEVMADGDVFVFGRLCGRVVAGLGSHSHPLPTNTTSSGDLQHGGEAMYQIFATSFEPSLVGIGSVFVIPDDHLDCGKLKSKAVNVSIRRKETLAGDRLSVGSVVSIPCEGEDGKVEMVFRAIPI